MKIVKEVKKMKAKGSVFKYGDNIDTDVIIPARYLNQFSPEELAKHCMEDIDPSFIDKVNPGDIMVAGKNFGCGSSREHAPIAIKSSRISCVIAVNFARIFYRNAINIGLPILECKEAAYNINQGDCLEINFSTGIIRNLTRKQSYKSNPFPGFIQKIIEDGGLIKHIRKNLDGKQY